MFGPNGRISSHFPLVLSHDSWLDNTAGGMKRGGRNRSFTKRRAETLSHLSGRIYFDTTTGKVLGRNGVPAGGM